MPARKKSAIVQQKIRMHEPLRADIERAAKRNGVSMNGEMVKRLEMSFLEADHKAERKLLMDMVETLRAQIDLLRQDLAGTRPLEFTGLLADVDPKEKEK